jgi:DNA-binding CsgD family transcriptional regulator
MIHACELANRQEQPSALTDRQRVVLTTIDQYYKATGEACSVAYVARRLGLHPSTVREYVHMIAKKGWLRAPSSAAFTRVRRG